MNLLNYLAYLLGIASYLYLPLNLSVSSYHTNFDKFDVTSLIWVFPLVAIPSVTLIIFYNKSNQSKSEEKKKDERSQNKDADYEQKYEEYVKKLNDEIRQTDQKYKKLYSKIMNIMNYKSTSTPRKSRLHLLLKRYHNLFSQTRIGLYKKIEKLYPQVVEYINFTTKWSYKNFRRRTVHPVAKGDKVVDRKKLEEISLPAFKAHQRRVPYNHIWPVITQWFYNPFIQGMKGITEYQIVQPYRKEYLFDVLTANYRDMYKLYLIYNLEYGLNNRFHKSTPTFYSRVIKKFINNFPVPDRLLYARPLSFPFRVLSTSLEPYVIRKEYRGPNIWRSIAHYMYMWTFPHSDKDQFSVFMGDLNREDEYSRWPWLHQLHTIYSKNRVRYFQESVSKQRLKHLFNDHTARKKSLRSKMRFKVKYNRNSPNVWANYYLYKEENFKKLYKSLQLLYSKYPIYKTSTRHMSKQYLVLLKGAQKRLSKRLLKNRDHKFFETVAFFRGVNFTRSVTKRRNKRKIPPLKIVELATYRINLLRENFMWKYEKMLKGKVLPRLNWWLIDKTKFIKLVTPLMKLDVKMASFAITNPSEFAHRFKTDLLRLKANKHSYLQFLLRDPYSIQKLGSDFFYYLGIHNPIYVKGLSLRDQMEYAIDERVRLGGGRDDPNSERTLSRKNIFMIRRKKKRHKLRHNYPEIKRYNAYNFLNSLLKSILLSTISKKDHINTTKDKPFFHFLYKLNSQPHLKTLYGFLFKTEDQRGYLKPFNVNSRNQVKRITSPSRYYSVSKILYNRQNQIPTPPLKNKYSIFKRYLKLKLQGALPKGVHNVGDWYQLVKSWEWTMRPSSPISSRSIYVPFHLIAFNLRTHLYRRFVRRGIRPYRYNEKIRLTHEVRNNWRKHSKFLDPKRRMISRLSRTTTRLNQTRYSLLNNQYLFMKELLQKHIKEPTMDYYKHFVSIFTSPLSNRFFTTPNKFLYMYNICVENLLPTTNTLFTSFFTSPSFIHCCDEIIKYFITQSTGLKPFYHKLSTFLMEKCIMPVIQHFTLVVVIYSCYFRSTWFFNCLQLLSRYLGLDALFRTDHVAFLYISRICYTLYTYFEDTLKIACFIAIELLLAIASPIMVYLLLPIYRTIVKGSLQTIAVGFFHTIFSLFKDLYSILWIMIMTPLLAYSELIIYYTKYHFVPIFKRLVLFWHNLLFTSFLFKFTSWVSPGVMSSHEHKLLTVFYIMINKLQNRDWRFILQFRHLLFKDDFHVYIHHGYSEYYARWMHFIFRERRMFRRLYSICIEYITSYFFGSLFRDKFAYLWRGLWLAHMDAFIARTIFFSGAHILMSPAYIGYAVYLFFTLGRDPRHGYTFDLFSRYIHRQIVFICGLLFGYPTYYFYNNVICAYQTLSTIFAAFAMAFYNYLIALFVFSHTFINVFFFIRPVVFELAYETLFGGWPDRWIGGYRFAVTSEAEIFTATTIISLIIMNLLLTYFVAVELNRPIFTLVRSLIILSRKPSNPFKWIDFNQDLEYPNTLGGVQGMYLRYIYKTLFRVKYDFYNNRNIFWLFFNKPVKALILFRHVGKPLLSNHRSLAGTHLRKYSDVLFNSPLLKSKVQLSTKWIQNIYPIIDPKRYDKLLKLDIPADKDLFYWDWDDVITLAPRIKSKQPWLYPRSIKISTKDPIYQAYLNGQKNKSTAETRQSYEYLLKRLPSKLRKYFRPYNRIQEPVYALLKRFFRIYVYIYYIPAIILFLLESYQRLLLHGFTLVIIIPKYVWFLGVRMITPEGFVDNFVPAIGRFIYKVMDYTNLNRLFDLDFDIAFYRYVSQKLKGTDLYETTAELHESIFRVLEYLFIGIRSDVWRFFVKCTKIVLYIIIDLIQYPYICYYEVLDLLILETSNSYDWLKDFQVHYEWYCNRTRKKPSSLLVRKLYPIIFIPFKVFYQIFMYRLFNKGSYPHLDNKYIFESEINIVNKLMRSAPTHSHYYIYYDRNIKRHEDFKKGKRYAYDHFTSADQLKNQ